MRRSFLALALFVVGCGSRTLADGFDIDTTTDGASTDTGTTTTDGAVNVDGSTPVEPSDGGTVEPERTISCGMDKCSAATEDCCISGGAGAACRPRGSCTRGVALSCSSTASCATGQVCCFRASGMGGAATCTTTCSGGRETFRLCETDSECNAGTTCRGVGFGSLRSCR